MMKQIFLVLLCATLKLGALAQLKNLVFEGGGIRGLAYAGALQALEEKQMLASVERAGGTSAGAIVAMLFCLGYSPGELLSIIQETPFQQFNEGRYLFPGGLKRLTSTFGWYHGEKMEAWLAELVKRKTGKEDLSFAELHQLVMQQQPGAKAYRDLAVTATCLNQQRAVYINYQSFPDLRIVDGVRMSASIPLYFEPVYLDSTNHVVRHPKSVQGLNIMVDGGMIANYPIRIFEGQPGETLGFRIDRPAVANAYPATHPVDHSINNIQDYISAFYHLSMDHMNPMSAEDWSRTICISDGDISPRIRRLKDAERDKLTGNGYSAVLAFLDCRAQSR